VVLLLGPVALCRRVFHLTRRFALGVLPRIVVGTRETLQVSLDFVFALSGRSPPAPVPASV
jgi:hypothetical protein